MTVNVIRVVLLVGNFLGKRASFIDSRAVELRERDSGEVFDCTLEADIIKK